MLTPLTLAGSGSPSESTATVIELWIVATSVACLIVGIWLADRAVHGLAIVGLLASVGVLVGDLVGGSQGGSIAAVVVGVGLLSGAILAIRSWGPAAPVAPTTPPAMPGPPSP